MNNVEVFFDGIYYPYNSAYDGAYMIDGIKNIYYLVYDDKKDIKYATLGLIFSLSTLSSLMFLIFCCNNNTQKSTIQYKSLKKRNVEEIEEA